MNYWFTTAEAPIRRDYVKRFDPLHWTVDFPRGAMASIVTSSDSHGLEVTAEFLRKGDLVGVILESEDRYAHPAHARDTSRDYSGCTLRFRWRSNGVMPLDAPNGPTLTLEGHDLSGSPRSWFVRLWNYAEGTPSDAIIELDFDALDGGFALPGEADRVNPINIERMFISIVAPAYVEGSQELFSTPVPASVNVTDLRCEGRASVLTIRDAIAPEHGLRMATAYDDMYNLPPARVVESIDRLGYRKLINHYVGMSHYFALDGTGKLDARQTMNSAADAWHRELARHAAARGFDIIWSLSFEILDMFCPDAWKQRAFDGSPAATGYSPPSTLVSPANQEAIAFLTRVAEGLVALSVEAGIRPRVQIGEPWWWITSAGAPCLYDAAARDAFGGLAPEIGNVRESLNSAQTDLLDRAGAVLAAATATIAAAVKSAATDAETLLLAYLPGMMDPRSPEVRRANLPLGWAFPAFDVLQLEDYEWVTEGRVGLRSRTYAEVDARLGYPVANQHYLAGFVATAAERERWSEILGAAGEAKARGVSEKFLWAYPQVVRDGLTIFGEEQDVQAFDDVLFPIEIGAEASVAPAFSTSVVTSAGGHEFRNVNWQQARLSFDAGPGVRSDAELETLIAFFRARRGPSEGFRFRDPYDHSSKGMTGVPAATDQQLGIGDGVRSQFDLVKRYGASEARRITRPIAGSVRIAVDGVEQSTGWTLETLGTVTFDAAPPAGAVVTAGFLFDVPVRFAEDRLEVNRASFLAGEAPSVTLLEIREG